MSETGNSRVIRRLSGEDLQRLLDRPFRKKGWPVPSLEMFDRLAPYAGSGPSEPMGGSPVMKRITRKTQDYFVTAFNALPEIETFWQAVAECLPWPNAQPIAETNYLSPLRRLRAAFKECLDRGLLDTKPVAHSRLYLDYDAPQLAKVYVWAAQLSHGEKLDGRSLWEFPRVYKLSETGPLVSFVCDGLDALGWKGVKASVVLRALKLSRTQYKKQFENLTPEQVEALKKAQAEAEQSDAAESVAEIKKQWAEIAELKRQWAADAAKGE